MSEKTLWIVCQQQHYGAVKYQTSEGVNKHPSYMDFLELMMKYSVQDPREFKKQLDTFRLLYIDLATGEWEEIKLDHKDEYTFEELLTYNQKFEERESKKDSVKNNIDKGKRFIFGKRA